MFEQEFEKMLRQYMFLIDDRKKFSGLVKDFFPDQAKIVNLLLIVYNMGIAEDIKNTNTINKAFAYKYVKQMIDNYGISRSNADWIVSIWCFVYGEQVLKKRNEILIQKTNGGPAVPEQKYNSKKLYGENFSYSAPDEHNCVGIKGFSGEPTSTVILPNRYGNYDVNHMEYAAFAGTDIEEAIITEGYYEIGLEAFSGCRRLHQVVLPNSMREIFDSAFAGCINLKSVTLPSMLEDIGNRTFECTGLKTIVFPKSVYHLGNAAFMKCTELDNIEIPDNIKCIPDATFRGCTKLKKVKLSSSLETIEKGAFSGCTSLDFINIPDSVTKIGEGAFDQTDKLFIIQCSFGSFAEEYARKNKIKYQLA